MRARVGDCPKRDAAQIVAILTSPTGAPRSAIAAEKDPHIAVRPSWVSAGWLLRGIAGGGDLGQVRFEDRPGGSVMYTLPAYGIGGVIVFAFLNGIAWLVGYPRLHRLNVFSAGFVLGMLGTCISAYLNGYHRVV
jgi:hypothetical protein